MEPKRFDHLSRALVAHGPRRSVLGLLTAVPVVGGLLGILTPEETEGKGRRKRRKTRNKRRSGDDKKNRKGKGKKKKLQCTPESVTQTCANTCGSVTNSCQQPVDCGACTCTPACADCFTCQDGLNTPGTCVI
ncbi:MAG: hypothetical protein M3Z20_08915, partial [Chloroflexota bacterium]|nr:hypothetical protein [Chloroflexota bacterium]